ncbi:hypothetical protein FB45DRAFT_750527 [Roridomyces roridus]|uniref:Glycosyltransferase n=1 Tax=Roridomyces roridus TaxID=1738132 RepID=A0AAD7FL95_9AGAR|nr:hypothetical protein FB45DRAFT_750527 [Roridomyces roridus]
MDFFGGGFVFEPTKQILGSDCKTLLWWSTALVSLPGHLTDLDFAVIAQEIFSDETRRQGRSIEQILDAVVIAWNGTDKASGAVINFPGAPDMYDYERFARGAGTPEGLGAALVGAQKFAKLANGYIVPTARCLEPIGVLHWKQFCGNRGQEFFPVGVQANDACWMDNVPGTVAPTNERVKSFLDNAVSQHGGKSVLYISFGSLYFPFATREHVLALVETLLDLPSPFPFLFTLGGKLASLPTDLIERVNSSGKGLICDFWVEQREILQSGAIGWFLTHGGFNSTSESLTQGIPLIIWPLAAEQPVNAALLAQDPHPVAIELFQIRTGEQLGPSLRGGIPITGSVADAVAEFKRTFEVARGEKGALIKENAVNMAMELRRARRGEVAAEIKRLAAF